MLLYQPTLQHQDQHHYFTRAQHHLLYQVIKVKQIVIINILAVSSISLTSVSLTSTTSTFTVEPTKSLDSAASYNLSPYSNKALNSNTTYSIQLILTCTVSGTDSVKNKIYEHICSTYPNIMFFVYWFASFHYLTLICWLYLW